MGPQPSILQEVTLPIWRNDECRQKYGPAGNYKYQNIFKMLAN